MTQRIALTEADAGRNAQARDAALSRVSWPVNLAPVSVDYHSRGDLLIVGDDLRVRRAAARLVGRLASLTLLVSERSEAEESDDLDTLWATTEALPCFTSAADGLQLAGYLGRFLVTLPLDDGPTNLAQVSLAREHFDLVLDLGRRPLLDLELPPPGYYAPRDAAALEAALDALPGLVGEFDKPDYLQIDTALCAHAGRGQSGCTRCLAACPADAIASRRRRIEAWIEIDPFRCHGAGSCTAACPTGALQYRLPPPYASRDYLQRLLAAYAEAGGERPVLRCVDRATREAETTPPAGHLLDLPLEELGAAGLDDWLAALAYGACEVRLQYPAHLPPRMAAQLEEQLAQARGLLAALGHDPDRLTPLAPGDIEARDAPPVAGCLPVLDDDPAEGTKRERLDRVLAWLERHGAPDGRRHGLTSQAPFGGLGLDAEACTLCMGCVAVCPTPALAGGDDATPRLSVREADCVQCGLCVNACPEQAIRLEPGFLAAPERRERRVLKEEPAFACVRCGKPFATASTIARIKARLADHPYFAGEAAARLEMCEDCRVKDAWQALARNPEAQLKV